MEESTLVHVIGGEIPGWADRGCDGSGYGDGYGSGYGYWMGVAKRSLRTWATDLMQRLQSALLRGGFLTFWKSSKSGGSANGGTMKEAAAPGLVQKVDGPLALFGPRALHATLTPEKWQGERLWIVALHGEVVHSDNKQGALEREIIGEIVP